MSKLTDKERAIVLSCCFQPHYSGSTSKKFWKEVSDMSNDRVLYDFACALQDLEVRVLAAVNKGVMVRAEKVVRAHWARARKRP
jgi:hypothetical protein